MLPYENANSSGVALDDIRNILTRFGCTRFGTITDSEHGDLIIHFTYKGREVRVKASFKGYAAAWLDENPYNGQRVRVTKEDYEKKAVAQAEISVCSILRDWIKGQATAVETGVLSFEGAFFGQILLKNGETVLEYLSALPLAHQIGISSEQEACTQRQDPSSMDMHLPVAAFDAGDGVQIAACKQNNGNKLWCIRSHTGTVLNKSGEWELEPMPSNRDHGFFARCRFDTAQDARDAYLASKAHSLPQSSHEKSGKRSAIKA